MSRRAQISFAVFFLAVISVPPLWQTAVEVARGNRPQLLELFSMSPTSSRLRAWEHSLEETSVTAKAVRPWIQHVWFRLLHYAGEKVLTGREGWLFYRPDVRYLVEGEAFDSTHDDPLPAILDFQQQLARQGTRLILVPIPGKPSIYPDKLTARAATNGIRSPTLSLMARLRSAGVATIDLFHAFHQIRQTEQTPLYLRRDTHWSPQAAEAAAKMVAAQAREMGIPNGNVSYQVRRVFARRIGDIAKMIQIPEVASLYAGEEVQALQVMGLQEDPSAEVLVLGDSFSRIYQTDEPKAAGFIAQLALELRMPVASIVNDGGASTLVRQDLARRPQLLRGKKLVVWEFVERDIRYGTEGWKLVRLPIFERSPAQGEALDPPSHRP